MTGDGDARLRAEAGQLEQLLDELRPLVVPAAWQRIEDVLRRVTAIYGAGLAHSLDHARAAGASSARLAELIANDDLLGSLLVLHDLHPLTFEDRIHRALAAVRAELGLADSELVAVEIAGRDVRLRAARPLGGGAMASRVAEGVIRRALEAAAPEVAAIEIATPDPSLVQLRSHREAR